MIPINKKIILAVFAFIFFAVSLKAIELSTTENLAEIGTVGFVDIDEVLGKFPQVKTAKEDFESKLKEEEKKVEKKKYEIFLLKGKLVELKEERALLEGYGANPDEDLSANGALPVKLPGYDVAGKNVKALAPKLQENPAVETLISAKPQREEFLTPQKKLDIQIKNAEDELQKKQSEYKKTVTATREKFEELETIKKQKIMAEIYSAIEKVAKKERISVVVRKKDILFGQKMVDLTGKVLEELGPW